MRRAEALLDVTRALSAELAASTWSPPTAFVYDPTTYASGSWSSYVRKYGGRAGRVVLIGMNPGPYGMTQTGVPFGEPRLVRDWLGIEGDVVPPTEQHPKRPILGFDHPRTEVSGARFWGWARARHGTPASFFRTFYVVNWCHLCFLADSGRNLTPDQLAAEDRARLYPLCDAALRRQIELLAPRRVLGIGAFAEARARVALEGLGLRIGRILHPSPASPRANRGWEEQVEAQLRGYRLLPPRR
ncbi:MAG: single-stranded DNA-binding protein [Alphaproteobacteria bacterium]|nr:single-stranded DNA-binding protein [Alphaproteobacteria bacterium]